MSMFYDHEYINTEHELIFVDLIFKYLPVSKGMSDIDKGAFARRLFVMAKQLASEKTTLSIRIPAESQEM